MSDEIPFRSKLLYIEQWKRNRRCCESIPETHAEWHTTMCFYTALHAVNAAIAHLKEAGKLKDQIFDHTSRNNVVKLRDEFVGLRKKFLALYRCSRFARYDPEATNWLPDEVMRPFEIYEKYLYPIEKQVEIIIKQDLKLRELKAR